MFLREGVSTMLRARGEQRVLGILHEHSTFLGEFLRFGRRVIDEVLESVIDLSVGGIVSLSKLQFRGMSKQIRSPKRGIRSPTRLDLQTASIGSPARRREEQRGVERRGEKRR